MLNGELYPLISQDDVHSALDDLLYSSKRRTPTPLHFLLLIDLELFSRPSVAIATFQRQFALDDFLIRLISREYHHQRDVYEFPPLSAHSSRLDALRQLQELIKSPELAGWGLLYYRYVTTEFNLSLDELSCVMSVDERTLRRYFNHGFRRLLEKIIELERAVREQHHKRLLYNEIPKMGNTELVGREAFLDKLITLLRQDSPKHIQITGSAGVGKSALAEATIKALIDTNSTDRLIWVTNPRSVSEIKEILTERLLGEEGRASLRGILTLQPTVIVIDDFENIFSETEALDTFLLQDLAGANVLLISRIWVELTNTISFLLPELTYDETEYLIERVTSTQGKVSKLQVKEIWDQLGGNPQAIKLMLDHALLFDFLQASAYSIKFIYENIYASLTEELQRAWFVFLLIPNTGVSVTEIALLWPSEAATPLVEELLIHHLVTISDVNLSKCYVTSSVKRFLQDKYVRDTNARRYVHLLINNLYNRKPENPINVRIVEHILLSDWIDLDDLVRESWVNDYWEAGVAQGHYRTWRDLLSPYQRLPDHWSQKLGYGICLRRLSDFSQAESIFERFISDTGQKGVFLEQGRALIELSVVFRLRNQFIKALASLERVAYLLIRLPDSENAPLKQHLFAEQAQIMINLNKLDAANELISRLKYSSQYVILRGQMCFLREDIVGIEDLITEIASHPDSKENEYIISRFYTYLGQIHRRNGEFSLARSFLGLALMLASKIDGDVLGLAQAQSNMGALLVDLEEFDAAADLLQSAENIQQKFHDRVALFATRHNINLLNMRLAR